MCTRNLLIQTPIVSDTLDIQLEDLLPIYPSVDDSHFQELFQILYEFRELSSDNSRESLKPGEFFKHQLFVRRFMSIYNELLLFHDPGTGKSCSFGAASEYFIASAGKTNIKRMVVIAPRPAIISELKHQLICRCTSGKYEMSLINARLQEGKSTARAITAALSKYYEFHTYTSFINKWDLLGNDAVDTYSDVYFFVDEVHNLVYNKPGEKENTTITKEQRYNRLIDIFQTVERCKFTLGTATPMRDNPNEFIKIVNIFPTRKMPLDINLALDGITFNDIYPYIKGRLSYVRQLGANLDVHEVGIEDKTSGVTMFTIPMVKNSLQETTYLEEAQIEPVNVIKGSLRQAANFVYPNGDFGKDGFKKYITRKTAHSELFDITDIEYKAEEKTNVTEYRYIATPQLISEIESLDKLRQLSCKYAEVCKIIAASPGNVFIYDYYVHGSGLIALTMCLEHLKMPNTIFSEGFEMFDELISVFSSQTGEPLTYCGTQDRKSKPLRQTFRKTDFNVLKSNARGSQRPRYAFLTERTPTRKFDSMREAMNSYENRHGELIKVFITSDIGKEGLSIYNVQTVIVIGPGYNESNIDQARGRANRATSFDDLIAELKQKYIQEGRNPNDAKVELKIYNMAAYVDTSNRPGFIQPLDIDVNMYILSREKDKKIKKIERFLKIAAVDCNINYRRNVRPTDTNGSRSCDYMICDYKCVSGDPGSIDYTNYDIIYSEDAIDNTIDLLRIYFQTHYNVSIRDVIRSLSSNNIRRKLIILALDKVINEQVIFLDRYGFRAYLREDSGRLYLVHQYPEYNIYPQDDSNRLLESQYYTQNIDSVSNLAIDQVLLSEISLDDIKLLLSITDIKTFNNRINGLSHEDRKRILEVALVDYINGQQLPAIKYLIEDRYRYLLHVFHEPVNDIIADTNKFLGVGKKGRGRPPTKNIAQSNAVVNINPQNNQQFPLVYVSAFDSIAPGKQEYAKVTSFMNGDNTLRIYKPWENSWYNATNVESRIYRAYIKLDNSNVINNFKQRSKVFGIELPGPNGKELFRIRNYVSSIESDMKEAKGPKRKKGTDCNNLGYNVLIDILWYLRMNLPNGISIEQYTLENPQIQLYQLILQLQLQTNLSTLPSMNQLLANLRDVLLAFQQTLINNRNFLPPNPARDSFDLSQLVIGQIQQGQIVLTQLVQQLNQLVQLISQMPQLVQLNQDKVLLNQLLTQTRALISKSQIPSLSQLQIQLQALITRIQSGSGESTGTIRSSGRRTELTELKQQDLSGLVPQLQSVLNLIQQAQGDNKQQELKQLDQSLTELSNTPQIKQEVQNIGIRIQHLTQLSNLPHNKWEYITTINNIETFSPDWTPIRFAYSLEYSQQVGNGRLSKDDICSSIRQHLANNKLILSIY